MVGGVAGGSVGGRGGDSMPDTSTHWTWTRGRCGRGAAVAGQAAPSATLADAAADAALVVSLWLVWLGLLVAARLAGGRAIGRPRPPSDDSKKVHMGRSDEGGMGHADTQHTTHAGREE